MNGNSQLYPDKSQAEVRRLHDDLEIMRLQRLESSESLFQHVRSRLEGLQVPVCLPAVHLRPAFIHCF